MAGGLIQLVAYGVQDLYLTGDPQITFFKILYRRHTNFAIESVVQNFSTAANFGETVSSTLSRSGDLVGKIFLYVEVPAMPKFVNPDTGEEDSIKKMAWVHNLGYALVNEISIEIDNKLIDKQYGEWMYIWSQVSNKKDHGLNKMVGNVPAMYEFSNGKPGYQLYIPLEFWFCRNNGLALPLIALTSSDVKITVSFRRLEECYRIGPTHSIEVLEDIVPFQPGDYIEQTVANQKIYGYVIGYDYLQKKLYYIKINSPTASKKAFEANTDISQLNTQYRIYNSRTQTYVTPKPNSKENIEPYGTSLREKPRFVNSFFYVNYVYLDNDERAKFARNNHEYLIEQIQFNKEIGITSPNVKQNLALKHPCKAFYWVAQMDSLVGPGTINDLFNYTSSHIHSPQLDYDTLTDNPVNTSQQHGKGLIIAASLKLNGKDRFGERDSAYLNLIEPYQHHYRGPAPGINVYSPSLYPEDYQPSSAINMSKIDQISSQLRLSPVINSQNTAKVRNYTINYNILRVYFGMAGVAFT